MIRNNWSAACNFMHAAFASFQAQADISQVIDELASTRQNYTMRRDQCAALLQELDDEQAGYELEQSQMAPPSSVDYAALQVCALDHCTSCMSELSLR